MPMQAGSRVLAVMVLLCAAGSAHAQFAIVPGFVDFAPQQVFFESPPQSVTLGNAGNQPLAVDSVSIANPVFRLVGGSCGPAPISIAAQSSCTLEFTFTPSATGPHSDAAILRAAGVELGLVHLHGTGVRGQLQVHPFSSITFSTVAVGETSDARTVELRSVGDGVVQVTAISSAAAPFTRVGGSCGAMPITLQPAQSCSLSYTFSPSHVGPALQVLAIDTSPAVSAYTLTLEGDGAPGVQTTLLVDGFETP